MDSDFAQVAFFMFLAAMIVGMPAGCAMVKSTSDAQTVCVEAHGRKLEIDTCKPILDDMGIIADLTYGGMKS